MIQVNKKMYCSILMYNNKINLKCFDTFLIKKTEYNPISTGHGRNQPIYECHVTIAGRNRVKNGNFFKGLQKIIQENNYEKIRTRVHLLIFIKLWSKNSANKLNFLTTQALYSEASNTKNIINLLSHIYLNKDNFEAAAWDKLLTKVAKTGTSLSVNFPKFSGD